MWQLQKLNTLDLGDTYAHNNTCKDFISHIAQYYFDKLKKKADDSDYFSILQMAQLTEQWVRKELLW